MITLRRAVPEDEVVLTGIDLSTWTSRTSPVPPPVRFSEYRFFSGRTRPQDVIVAESGYLHCGYVKFRPTEDQSPARAHILEVTGLAVDPLHQRMGVGRRLVEAAAGEARLRGARKLSLRVLGTNERARRLYEACGFVIDAMLRDEYYLDGRFVDDVLMSLPVGAAVADIA